MERVSLSPSSQDSGHWPRSRYGVVYKGFLSGVVCFSQAEHLFLVGNILLGFETRDGLPNKWSDKCRCLGGLMSRPSFFGGLGVE